MKKIILTVFSIVAITVATNAQDAQPKMSKEQKEAAKAKKEADLVEAFKSAGLTDEEQKKAKEIMDAAGEKSKVVKQNTTLSEDDKKAKFEEINKEKNTKLKEAMGEAKFKAFQAARKLQKENAAKTEAVAPVKE